ncbi:hypothetical protein HZF05_05935 [Sphingomonas sp. CGMCC 1.13654]|uniref:Uncharacterized protein n=1 Tax=Sphingomonas chungangi TaxID=2683589 RepID=A0A838L377_9SPHN|nr:hypothetical protein [Sphingomonas chungangi]
MMQDLGKEQVSLGLHRAERQRRRPDADVTYDQTVAAIDPGLPYAVAQPDAKRARHFAFAGRLRLVSIGRPGRAYLRDTIRHELVYFGQVVAHQSIDFIATAIEDIVKIEGVFDRDEIEPGIRIQCIGLHVRAFPQSILFFRLYRAGG